MASRTPATLWLARLTAAVAAQEKTVQAAIISAMKSDGRASAADES
jgi:hypothetical protein